MERDNAVISIHMRVTKNLCKVRQQIQWSQVRLLSGAPLNKRTGEGLSFSPDFIIFVAIDLITGGEDEY